MEARAVVGVGSNYRDSGGKLPRAWGYGWGGHRSQGLPLTSCRSGMSLGTEGHWGVLGGLAGVSGSCNQGGGPE